MRYQSEAIQPISREAARNMLDASGFKDSPLPRMGYLIHINDDQWIENVSGHYELVTFSKLIKPAWLDPVTTWDKLPPGARRIGHG
jgi:hypothetical protein